MKATKLLYISILVTFFWQCQDDDRPTLQEQFVRFSFQLNNNGVPLVFPQQSNNALEVFSYTLDKNDTLRLPVVLSTPEKTEHIQLDFSTSFNSIGEEDVIILPHNSQLHFSNSKFSDTIYLVPQKRFSNINQSSIHFELTQINNNAIHLGYPREQNNLSSFTVNVENTQPIVYSFEDLNFEIEGNQNEELSFSILFDQLVSFDEIENLDFIETEFVNFVCDENPVTEFNFNIELVQFDNQAKKVKVNFTILEDLGDFQSNLSLQLRDVDSDNFLRQGNSLISITKDGLPDLEREGDPASNWYNANNNFHRTFGRSWYFDETDAACDWQSFQTFTRPVDVNPEDEFDNGQGYHRFKIGFRSIIPNPNGDIIGTNPFDFRRFYNGASVFSPAYALEQAIEFFPDPNQTDAGIVRVIPRTLQFLVDDSVVSVPMCGSGNYSFNSTLNTWEMFVTLICDETEINGNPLVEKHVFIYSLNISGDPEDLDVICSPLINF